MTLKKAQKDAVLAWIAEGLESDEINKRAAKFKPKFHVSRRAVAHYRKTRGVQLDEIKAADETSALKAGFAVKENRVKALNLIADKLLAEMTREEDNRLWTTMVKGIGSAENYERVEYQEFNKAEVDAFRGLLDDIAMEVGERSKRDTSLNIDLSKLTDAQLERIAKGEDPVKVLTNA